jgi:anti-sigma regulatory factor (Ser/Thr protein kinase)
MAISDHLKAVGPVMLQVALRRLDRQDDETTRELMRQPLLKLATTTGLPKDRMRRLATLLSEAASSVAEDLKPTSPTP